MRRQLSFRYVRRVLAKQGWQLWTHCSNDIRSVWGWRDAGGGGPFLCWDHNSYQYRIELRHQPEQWIHHHYYGSFYNTKDLETIPAVMQKLDTLAHVRLDT